MADSVLKVDETVQKSHRIVAIQISNGLECSLVASAGKKGSMFHEEFTAETQKKIEEAFGAVSAELIKKVDPASTVTIKLAADEAKAQIEAKPKPEPKPVP